jgi:hypothetical protein
MRSARQPRTLHRGCESDCALGLMTAASLKEILGGKAYGGIPLNDHPAQSAGLALSDFFRMRAKLSAKQSLWQEPSSQAWVVATEINFGLLI